MTVGMNPDLQQRRSRRRSRPPLDFLLLVKEPPFRHSVWSPAFMQGHSRGVSRPPALLSIRMADRVVGECMVAL